MLTADRLFGTLGHQTVTIVCYGDNHVGSITLRALPPHGDQWTTPADGSSPRTAINADAGGREPDNIYDAWSDGPGMQTPHGGSSSRAWVR